MKIFKIKSTQIIVVFLLTFTFINCSSKKNTFSNKNVVIENDKKNNISGKNILYLLDGKEISEKTLKEILPNNIKRVSVIKEKKEIAKHTDKEYDGVIIIELKK